MKKLNQGYWPALVLTLICLVFTALLSITNEITAEKRAANKSKEIMEGKKAIFPEAKSFKALKIPAKFKANIDGADVAKDQSGNVIGVTIQSKAKGYNGLIPVIVGIDTEHNIKGVTFTANEETVGLGSKIKDPPFADQFLGAPAGEGFSLDGAKGLKIEAVSGATFSSVGAVDAVNFACELIEEVEVKP